MEIILMVVLQAIINTLITISIFDIRRQLKEIRIEMNNEKYLKGGNK